MTLKSTTAFATCRILEHNIATGSISEGIPKTAVKYPTILDTYKLPLAPGFFIPGSYRVLPDKRYEFRKTWLTTPFTVLSKPQNGSYYELIITGDFPGILLTSYSDMVLPSITSNVSGLDTYALQKAYAKLAKNDVGLGENLGELTQTLQMLKSPLKSLRDFLGRRAKITGATKTTGTNHDVIRDLSDFFRSGRKMWKGREVAVKDMKSTAKMAADSWLEVRYGLLPLLYTAMDVIEMVKAKEGVFDANLIRSCVSTQNKLSKQYLGFKTTLWFSGFLSAESYAELVDRIRVHASVQYRFSGTRSTQDRLGLTPRFLPELGWELSYCSFVVDWWLDVGTWLGAMRISPGIEVLGNTVSIKVAREVTLKANLRTSLVPPAATVNTGDVGWVNDRFFERKCHLSLPLLPHWKPEFKSYMHAVDALSLIYQGIKPKK